MRFDEQRLFGDDPTYAPCLAWPNGHPRWRCPPRYIKAGYPHKSISIGIPGTADDDHALERAALCRQHTRDLLAWWRAQEASLPDYGTWAYLIHRYQSDEFSPYQEVKQNTRELYDILLRRWHGAIGHMPIEALDYTGIREIQKVMREKGRTESNIRRMFTMLRTVAKYAGFALKIDEAREVSQVLSEIRFKTPAARSSAPTRDQVYAIVAQADREGFASFAAGIILQFELALRAVDVRGQWLKEPGQGGIRRNGKRWQDGLTWDMFDADLTTFSKVLSKTEKSLPEPYTFDLTPLPDLRRRLEALRAQKATGPVIVTERFGLPYDRHAWSNLFRRLRDAAGVPDSVTAQDLRAGGLTEAKGLSVDPYALRDAAGHTQVSTTDRYSRDRSAAANKVVALRQGNVK